MYKRQPHHSPDGVAVLCIATARQREFVWRWAHTGSAAVQYELSRTSRTANTSIVRDNSYLALNVLNENEMRETELKVQLLFYQYKNNS